MIDVVAPVLILYNCSRGSRVGLPPNNKFSPSGIRGDAKEIFQLGGILLIKDVNAIPAELRVENLPVKVTGIPFIAYKLTCCPFIVQLILCVGSSESNSFTWGSKFAFSLIWVPDVGVPNSRDPPVTIPTLAP